MPVTLKKAQESAGIHLAKSGLDTSNMPNMRVGLCLDVSGSMHHDYRDGHVQDALTHLLGLAMHMDKSQKMDVFTFENDCAQCRYPATEQNYHNFIDEHIVNDNNVPKWGGTEYAGVMHLVYQHYFPDLQHLHTKDAARAHVESGAHKKHGLFSGLFGHHHPEPAAPAPDLVAPPQTSSIHVPTLIIFMTDGEANDEGEARMAVHAGTGLPLFWAFVGLDHDSRFLRGLSQESDAEFVHLADGVRISDEQLYGNLISPKLVNWISNQK